ncbi:unnamed protein product [Parascedosporium putredinis]|uniref:GAR domain-containing protein n=1 Tax=Parascedosporium putredinis TaxID=1442378 RepID=A0A9P1GTP3_9PEZI|nr:unnamed protein product [Parascedosporium putredinis]CAI7987442.1 unnamed protein product [Parascedosporium putredinis]
MRTAVASQTIYEWLHELLDWPWPVGSAASGFLLSVTESRRTVGGTEFFDSIPISEISRYDTRIEEISVDMDHLGIEEIKAHILHNHIMPLSRPGTPMSDSSRLTASALAYIRMEDITAVVTAVILQALPNLSKLSRLLNVWNIRISVLRHVPDFLSAVDDAEDLSSLGGDLGTFTTLTKKDSQIMRLVLEKKGLDDTLPDEWLDRMESVERGYSDWVAACDTKIREAEWARSAVEQRRRSLILAKEHGAAAQSASFKNEDVVPRAPLSADELEPEPEPESESESESEPKPEPTLQDAASAPSVQATTVERAPEHDRPSLSSSPSSQKNEPEIVVSDGESESEPESETSGVLINPAPDGGTGAGMRNSPLIVAPDEGEVSYDEDTVSISSSPLLRGKPRASSVTFSETLPIPSIEEDEGEDEEDEDDDEDLRPSTPFTESFLEDVDVEESPSVAGTPSKRRTAADDQLQQQISDILDSIPAKFTLNSEPSPVNLNPPDFKMPRMKKTATTRDPSETRCGNPRPRQKSTQQDIKVYHLSRATGEAPIKLFIRCVGENGERVMVRVGGGWADLGEYLKEYASHHGRRSKAANNDKIEIRDAPRAGSASRSMIGSSPPSRPASAMEYSPLTPLHVKKTRKSFGAASDTAASVARRPPLPHTPLPAAISGPSSRLSWGEADSPMLGLAGPTSRPVEMSDESRAWVESVKEKVRIASGERKASAGLEGREKLFGEMGKVGGTKRLFRKGQNG